jgi:hypothetical protein
VRRQRAELCQMRLMNATTLAPEPAVGPNGLPTLGKSAKKVGNRAGETSRTHH